MAKPIADSRSGKSGKAFHIRAFCEPADAAWAPPRSQAGRASEQQQAPMLLGRSSAPGLGLPRFEVIAVAAVADAKEAGAWRVTQRRAGFATIAEEASMSNASDSDLAGAPNSESDDVASECCTEPEVEPEFEFVVSGEKVVSTSRLSSQSGTNGWQRSLFSRDCLLPVTTPRGSRQDDWSSLLPRDCLFPATSPKDSQQEASSSFLLRDCLHPLTTPRGSKQEAWGYPPGFIPGSRRQSNPV